MNHNRLKTYILPLIVILWGIFILISYFILHKPFTPIQILVLGRAILQTLIAILVLILGAGLGKKIYQRFFPASTPSLSRQAGLGIGLVSMIYLGISAVYLVNFWISVGFVFVLLLLVYHQGWMWLRQLSNSFAQLKPTQSWQIGIFCLILLDVILTWFMAASPPVKYDALLYHLELPEWYQIKGKFFFVYPNERWGMPQIGEMLYTLMMTIAGESAATLLGWVLGWLALFATVEVFPEWKNSSFIWLGILVPLAGIGFLDSLGWGYVDWLTYLWGVLALQVLLEYIREGNQARLIEGGIYCGFALGTKYTAGILSLAFFIGLIWNWCKKIFRNPQEQLPDNYPIPNQYRVLLSHILIFGITVFVTTLPWWLKNIFATGQPFYPLLFPAGTMNAIRLHFYTKQPVWGNGWLSLFLPWTATVLGVEGKAGFSSSIGPLFLLLSPFAWLNYRSQSKEKKEIIQLMSLIGLFLWIVWGIGSRISGLLIQTRFYWSLFPALVVLAVLGYENISTLEKKPINLIFVLNSVILIVFGLTSFQILTMTLQRKSPQYVLGMISKEEYLENNLGWYAVAMEHIRDLEPSKPVLLLFEPRDYYCLPYCDSDEILDEWYSRSYSDGTNLVRYETIVNDLKNQGYGYLMIYADGVKFVKQDDPRYTPKQWELLDQTLNSLKLIDRIGSSYSLYQIPE